MLDGERDSLMHLNFISSKTEAVRMALILVDPAKHNYMVRHSLVSFCILGILVYLYC